MTAVTSTVVSPCVTRTAPVACLASSPVSKRYCFPYSSKDSTIFSMMPCSFSSPCRPSADKLLRLTGYSPFPRRRERTRPCASDRYAKARRGGLSFGWLDVVSDAQLLDERAVLFDVAVLDVLQKAAALADEHHEPAARVVVLLVDLQMLGQVADALRKDG